MPKMKTHKGLAKRVKVTASGKIKYKRSYGSHLNSSKSGKRLRRIRRPTAYTGALAKPIRIALGQDLGDVGAGRSRLRQSPGSRLE